MSEARFSNHELQPMRAQWLIIPVFLTVALAFFIRRDLGLVILWWGAWLVLGVFFLPLANRLFGDFFDRGYPFAKTLGSALPALLMWFCSSLHLARFSRASLLILSLGLISLVIILNRRYATFRTLWIENWRTFVCEEFLFVLVFLSWVALRGTHPAIHGLEKFMDFGFVNAILKSDYMPPSDMWMSGKTLNYYYFGHFLCAFFTRLTGLDSAVTYNLMLATLVSLCFTLTFSLTANALFVLRQHSFRKVVSAGLLGALLLTFGSNLHPFIYGQVLPALQYFDVVSGPAKGYWYPDATRYVGHDPPTNDKTIHEFPAYSFVVADLHGHVSNLPNVLTLLALLLQLTSRKAGVSRSAQPLRWYSVSSSCLLISLFLSICCMTNLWDFPTFFGATLLMFLVFHWRARFTLLDTLLRTGIQGLQILILAVVFASPFLLSFVNFSEGVSWVHSRTPIYQLLILWGCPLAFVALFFSSLFLSHSHPGYSASTQSGRAGNWVEHFKRLPAADVYVCMICICGIGLILLPELIYVKDIYDATQYRANTMFKLTFQAFVLFCVAVGYIVPRILLRRRRSHVTALGEQIMLFLLVPPMIYPYYAVRQAYDLSLKVKYQGLDGFKFLQATAPDDYLAIEWLNKNVRRGAIVLEANGDSYSDFGRLSAATGLPTVLGWHVHELLWHGDQELAPRMRDIADIYQSTDPELVKELLRKYNVDYVLIGKMERQKFNELNEEGLSRLGKVVFCSQETRIIRFK